MAFRYDMSTKYFSKQLKQFSAARFCARHIGSIPQDDMPVIFKVGYDIAQYKEVLKA